jgi:hypothetical protein
VRVALTQFSRMSACRRNMTRCRSEIETSFQVLKAFLAESTAASISSLVVSGRRLTTSWVASGVSQLLGAGAYGVDDVNPLAGLRVDELAIDEKLDFRRRASRQASVNALQRSVKRRKRATRRTPANLIFS